MMSHEQYLTQVRSSDLAQLEESDISPMILRSLAAGRPFSRLPFFHPDGDLVTSILAYLWFIERKRNYASRPDHDAATMEWRACAKVGLTHHVLVAIHESVMVLRQTFRENRHVFPEVPTRSFGSPGYITLLVHAVWTSFFDRCLIRLPTGEYVSPQFGGSWALESTSLCHNPRALIALNRTTRDGASYVNCLTPVPEKWLVERDWFIVTIGKTTFVEKHTKTFVFMQSSNTYVPLH